MSEKKLDNVIAEGCLEITLGNGGVGVTALMTKDDVGIIGLGPLEGEYEVGDNVPDLSDPIEFMIRCANIEGAKVLQHIVNRVVSDMEAAMLKERDKG